MLAEFLGRRPRRIFAKDPASETILHRLGVARLQLLVKDAAASRQFEPPNWILEHDTNPGVGIGASLAERFILFETFATDDGTISCRPDASCWLQFPDTRMTAHHLVVYWEFDRSTEPLKQFARKIPGYHALLTANSVAVHWPKATQPTVCVFVVTPSPQRRDNLALLVRNRPGAEAFRFVQLGDLSAASFFNAPVWHTATGEARSILRANLAA